MPQTKVPKIARELWTPNITQKRTIGRGLGDGRPGGSLEDGLVGIIASSGGGRSLGRHGRRSGRLGDGVGISGPESLHVGILLGVGVGDLVDDGRLDGRGGLLGSFAAGHDYSYFVSVIYRYLPRRLRI